RRQKILVAASAQGSLKVGRARNRKAPISRLVGILNVLWAGWQLYVRLFARSVTLAAVVFAVLYLPPLFALTGGGSEVAGLLGAAAFSGLLYLVGELLL